MYNLSYVTNTILKRARDEGIAVSPMKIQKLLYFLYKDFLQKCNRAMFAERFEPWPYGPVISEIYYAFRNYGDRPIKTYCMDAAGEMRYYEAISGSSIHDCLRRIWARYAHKTGIELSKITHARESAWYKAASQAMQYISDDDIKNEPWNLGMAS